MSDLSRRKFLAAGAGVTLATTVLVVAGCSSEGGSYGDPPPDEHWPDDPVTIDPDAVPVGGGIILDGSDTVVTQPEAGEFRAFSATCTHQGCQVSDVRDNVINCYCHGSRFSAEDGSVLSGPARGPLPKKELNL